MKIYSLKGGKRFSISRTMRPPEGDVVFFTVDEWTHLKAINATDAHKQWLWEQKHRDYRHAIVPEKGLTEPEVARKYCSEILAMFERKNIKKVG
jgi:hypothetical protein